MTLERQNLGGHMASAVSGIDLNRLPDTATQAALVRTLHDSLVLCIRGQELAPVAFRDAMALFGTPMRRRQLARTPECADVNIISSEDRDELGDGKKLVNGESWHTDDSFMREPCSLTMLYGVVVPSTGGDTQFTNMYEAYADLSRDMKARIDRMRVIHKYSSSRKLSRISTRPAAEMAAMPEATHPLVRTHPETGRKGIFVSGNWVDRIAGLPEDESEALLHRLYEHIKSPEFQCRFRWQRNSIAFWDNRITQHHAVADYRERRVMHRVMLAGDVPFGPDTPV